MHICVIPSWYPENKKDINGSFFREQSLALKNFGHRVGVVYPNQLNIRGYKHFTQPYFNIDVELDEGMPTFRSKSIGWIPFSSSLNVKSWVKSGLRLFELYISKHGKPDIIHCHCVLNAGLLASEIKKKYNIPFVITEHSTTFARNEVKPWQYKIIRHVLESSDRNIAVSEKFCRLLEEKINDGSDWHYIPNILPKLFEESNIAAKSAKSEFIFCNISILNQKKGIDLLIKAFALAFSGQNNVKLLIGGDGPDRIKLEKLVLELNVKEQVSFVGLLSRDQVYEIIRSCNAYVLSSLNETFGVTLIESLALGKPVVATKCGGPESIVKNTENGFLVETNDVNSLSSGMKKIYNQYDQFDATEIREDCIYRFGLKSVIKKVTLEYKKAIDK